MAQVTPPRAIVTVSSTYEVGGTSTATPVGHPLAIMAPRVATQPQSDDSTKRGCDCWVEASGAVPTDDTTWSRVIEPSVADLSG
nr:hypothetical protein [Tanacetum cinerariifolium]